MERRTLVDRLKGVLAGRDDIACAYLFGSRARDRGVREGARTPLAPAATKIFAPSDVDVAVLWSRRPADLLAAAGLDLAAELEDAVGLEVEVVALHRASPELIHRVLRDGILLVEHDRQARVRFEVAASREYFDVLPILRLYRGQEPWP